MAMIDATLIEHLASGAWPKGRFSRSKKAGNRIELRKRGLFTVNLHREPHGDGAGSASGERRSFRKAPAGAVTNVAKFRHIQLSNLHRQFSRQSELRPLELHA
jgi:hypothetical protein